MDTLKAFRITVVLSAALFVAFWFAPWAYGLVNEEHQSLLSYHGSGAFAEFPEWWSWLFFTATMVGYLGILLLRKPFRTWLLAVTVVGLCITPAYGISIITGIEAFMLDASSMLRGAALAMAYFSSIKGHFY